MQALSRQLSPSYPKADADRVAGLKPASISAPDNVADARMLFALLILAIFFVLLIACANSANLLLAIATGRRREALIKIALGASRGRPMREFLFETGLLCVCSAICGFALAWLVIAKVSEFETNLPASVITYGGRFAHRHRGFHRQCGHAADRWGFRGKMNAIPG